MSRYHLAKFSVKNTVESGIISLPPKAQFQGRCGTWARTWIEGPQCMFSSRKQITETAQAEPFKQNAGISTHSTYPSVIQSNSEVPVISPRKSKGEIPREPLGLKGKVLSLGRVQKKLKGAERAQLIMQKAQDGKTLSCRKSFVGCFGCAWPCSETGIGFCCCREDWIDNISHSSTCC
ncbi:hypothetical protein PVL29_022431 [Vitis rotundifolia]|uniref:Uncharacterized protein n=1 Tax=Vitis rotundifolia TaxID=103349 RepID=A0AA38YVG5_VITRO|nr:hypothetical protein PVL29_022431 [Vitis rotundifolia]